MTNDGGWIFAYGSLMWDPGVPVAEALPARLPGWHRSFCLRSIEHRGRPDCPGLVLGLDAAPGAECRGLALRIAAPDWPDAIATIRARELVTSAYREAAVNLDLTDGRHVDALTYVVRPEHPQYAGGLDLDRQAAIIALASGGRGPNAAYLASFVEHLALLGLNDPEFSALSERVRSLQRAG
ncbi:gamma-glutamylcyclotransferase [Paracoccus suum]|uniref:glutathione-specific gamma-glutamylcyclotransferase n=1 Tax=Paracoccus suum TaxID=2259340 RepID=A0A344PLR9_9RHOB|nr:gamma-glutamylcyclotransferase [Paracoccus suum]AXC50324.1 gamma-glutamylcyclotransferase [Paracoccus suum]